METCVKGLHIIFILKVNCKGFYKVMSYQRAFKMLKNDMCITEIGQELMGITAENDVMVEQ